MQNKLERVEKDYEILQQKFIELKISKKDHFDNIETERPRLKSNIELSNKYSYIFIVFNF